MFIEGDEIVEFKILYKKTRHIYTAYTEVEFKDFLEIRRSELDEKNKQRDKKRDLESIVDIDAVIEGEIGLYSSLNVKMKEVSWGLYNELQEGAYEADEKGERVFNYRKYKESRLITLLMEWDAKSKKGDPVKIDKRSIYNTPPPIAEAILRAYDDVSFINEETEKN